MLIISIVSIIRTRDNYLHFITFPDPGETAPVLGLRADDVLGKLLALFGLRIFSCLTNIRYCGLYCLLAVGASWSRPDSR